MVLSKHGRDRAQLNATAMGMPAAERTVCGSKPAAVATAVVGNVLGLTRAASRLQ